MRTMPTMTLIPTRCRSLLWQTAATLALALVASAPAAAQSAANGKLVYNTRYGTQNQGCYSCHGLQGSTLSNVSKIRNGVNNPTLIQSAISNDTGGMLFLKPYLSTAQVADIAAYLANPGLTGLTAAVASLSTSSLAFASTSVGSSSAALALTLSNTGTAALSLTSLASSSTSFRISGGTCAAGAVVAAGGSCSVSLQFSPAAAGALTGTLSLVHSVGTSSVALTGSGVALSPSAAASPTALSFTQAVGSTSATQTVTLSNTGTAALLVSSLALSGTAAADFSIAAGGTCSAGASVAAGSSCTVALRFAPTLVGLRAAVLAITHNAAGSPTSISLAGTASAAPQPTVALTASSLSFAAQVLGSSSAAQTITLSNSGSAALLLSGLTLGGSQPGDFSQAGSCTASGSGASLAAGASCSVLISFNPQALGSRSASLTVVSNASNASVVISLAGIGVATAAPAVSLAPAALDFGALTVGAAAASRTVVLSNTGSAALNLAGTVVTGSGFASSSTSSCGPALAAGASCNVALVFAPTAVGSASGLLSITSNAAGSPHSVALIGSGVLAALPVLAWQSAAALDLGTVAVGARSAAQVATLVNQGPGVVLLSGISAQGANASAGEFVLGGSCSTGLSLAAAASCTVSVVFAPASSGARSAALNVLSNGSNPVALALQGTGAAAAQPARVWAASSLALPSVAVGGTATSVAVVLRNSGNTTVTLLSLGLSSASFTAQAACGSLPLALAPGQTCEVDVAVNLAAVSSASTLAANLTVATDTSGLAPTLALTAVVTAASTAPAQEANDDKKSSGGGGCSAGRPGALLDPVLWLMCGLSAALLWRRRSRS